LIDELKRQGCEMNEDFCFHDFEIKELQPIIDVLEKYVIEEYERKIKKGINICDFQDEFENYKQSKNFTKHMELIVDTSYIFTAVNFLRYIKEDVVEVWNTELAKIEYKIKDGHHVYMSGF
jgi:hypothetical protein